VDFKVFGVQFCTGCGGDMIKKARICSDCGKAFDSSESIDPCSTWFERTAKVIDARADQLSASSEGIVRLSGEDYTCGVAANELRQRANTCKAKSEGLDAYIRPAAQNAAEAISLMGSIMEANQNG